MGSTMRASGKEQAQPRNSGRERERETGYEILRASRKKGWERKLRESAHWVIIETKGGEGSGARFLIQMSWVSSRV